MLLSIWYIFLIIVFSATFVRTLKGEFNINTENSKSDKVFIAGVWLVMAIHSLQTLLEIINDAA